MRIPIGENIIGTWKLVSWTYINQDGNKVHYFGENPTGILMYDTTGHMNVQLMKADRQSFQSSAIDEGTQHEVYDAFHSYIAYFGRFWESSPGEITHTIEGCMFPNWIGNKQVRYGKIEHDHLILETPPILALGTSIVFRITWKRM